MEIEQYYLVLEFRPNDFMPIDINTLLHETRRFNYNTLDLIDQFTKNYYEEEIIQMIKEENLVPEYYLNGSLKIINDKKYRFRLFTKDIDYDIKDFLINNIKDKIVMNKFVNIYQKYTMEYNDVNLLKEFIRKGDIDKIITILFTKPYEIVRNIYMYIDEKILIKVEKENKKVLKDLNNI